MKGVKNPSPTEPLLFKACTGLVTCGIIQPAQYATSYCQPHVSRTLMRDPTDHSQEAHSFAPVHQYLRSTA